MKTKLITAAAALLMGYAGAKAQNPLWVSPSSNKNYVGINNSSNPGSRLEITTVSGDPYFGSAGGSSGLKFTNMKAGTSSTITNPGPGVCAVDSNGHVIYVPAGTIGGACGSAAALTNNREVPMAGYNINYTMPASSASQHLIGFTACTTSVARFTVNNDFYLGAGLFQTAINSSSTAAGIKASATNTGSGNATAISGVATTPGTQAIGVNGSSQGSSSAQNIAINGNALNGTTFSIAGNLDCQNSSSPLNIGHQTDINGGSNGSATNYGSQILINNTGSVNYGIYASVTGATTNYAGYFQGDVYTAGGSNSGTGYLVASDKQFKTNINTVSNSSDIFKKLKPRSYYYDTTANNGMHFSGKKQYGFIAQELEEVFPELVYNVKKPADVDSDNKIIHEAISHKAVNYDGFIALLTAELQAQQATIEAMQKQVNQLLAASSGANNNANAATAIQNLNLSDADVVVLNQNQPNPFAEQTLITYNIPASANSAQMLFYDVNGKQINSVVITTKGKGALNVYANDLSNGTYSYTLVVDGKVIDTKKMVKQQ